MALAIGVHLALAVNLFFANNRNVVFALTGHHASLAGNARVQVDDHPPLMFQARIVLLAFQRVGINRLNNRGLFEV